VRLARRFAQNPSGWLVFVGGYGVGKTHLAAAIAQEKLFQLFNHRYMAQLPTVITMNNVETVDPRLLERMMEMKMVGAGSLIKLDIPPYRGLPKRHPANPE